MCGVTKTFGNSTSGESGGSGSGSTVSIGGTATSFAYAPDGRIFVGRKQGVRVDHFPAGDVDEDASGTKVCQLGGTDHAPGSRGQRHQDEDDVRLEHLVERAEHDSVGLGQLPRAVRIEHANVDVERPQQLDQATRDVAEADHADPLVAELGGFVARA